MEAEGGKKEWWVPKRTVCMDRRLIMKLFTLCCVSLISTKTLATTPLICFSKEHTGKLDPENRKFWCKLGDRKAEVSLSQGSPASDEEEEIYSKTHP